MNFLVTQKEGSRMIKLDCPRCNLSVIGFNRTTMMRSAYSHSQECPTSAADIFADDPEIQKIFDREGVARDVTVEEILEATVGKATLEEQWN